MDKCYACDKQEVNEFGINTLVETADEKRELILGINPERGTLIHRLYGTAEGLAGEYINYCPYCGRKLDVNNVGE